MIKKTKLPPQKTIKDFFDYKNGQLIRKKDSGFRWKIGSIAGSKDKQGYISVYMNGYLYKAHRLIYAWHNGNFTDDLFVDHINGNPDDNRIKNLRLVTHQENHFNRTKEKGISFMKQRNKWRSQIQANGIKKYLGSFEDKEDAINAYLMAKANLHTIENRL